MFPLLLGATRLCCAEAGRKRELRRFTKTTELSDEMLKAGWARWQDQEDCRTAKHRLRALPSALIRSNSAIRRIEEQGFLFQAGVVLVDEFQDRANRRIG